MGYNNLRVLDCILKALHNESNSSLDTVILKENASKLYLKSKTANIDFITDIDYESALTFLNNNGYLNSFSWPYGETTIGYKGKVKISSGGFQGIKKYNNINKFYIYLSLTIGLVSLALIIYQTFFKRQ